jgi:hypothetical protein
MENLQNITVTFFRSRRYRIKYMKMVPHIENKYANKLTVMIFLNHTAVLLLSFACVALFNAKNSNENLSTPLSSIKKNLTVCVQKFINKIMFCLFDITTILNGLTQTFTVVAFPFGTIQHVHHFPGINLSDKSLLSNDKF